MPSISCIIPAYNEGARIGHVLAAVIDHPLISEIIVVDDGSTDGTDAEAGKFKTVRVLVQHHNSGKSAAICAGIEASTGEYLLFLDADLVGLTANDVTALITPVLQGEADATISLRNDALLPWRLIGVDYLSGERVLRRSLLAPHLDSIKHLPGFGLESYINELTLREKSRIRIVRWETVGHTYKGRKYGIWKGMLGEWRMFMNIVETVTLLGTAHQIFAIARLRV